jgi:two-component system, chemotaxis family, sensor kinase CheA
MEIDLSQFHAVFFEESFESLDTMEQELLVLEEDSDKENINTIFRGAHSIKGGSATFNFKEVADFTHVLETLLDDMREGSRSVTSEIVNLLLKSVDCLRAMLTSIQSGEAVDASHKELIEQFNQLLISDTDVILTKTTSVFDNSTEIDKVETSRKVFEDSEHSKPWLIDFLPREYILETGNEPLRMFRELKTFGSLKTKAFLDKVPGFDELKPESCYIYWQLELDSDFERDSLEEVFEWVEDDCQLKINRSAISLNGVQPYAQDINTQSIASISEPELLPRKVVRAKSEDSISFKKTATTASIRVGVDKVDLLIDLVGELVITQSMLGELGDDFDMSKLNLLVTGLSELEQNTRELQESVMSIRMLPIGFVFNRLPRMVRDLSTQLGKKILLEIKGESTELDKTVMEQIGDPLTHLVRNALDHGIEPIDKRKLLGKPEEGLLCLNAFHQGGNIVIEISDDGAGISPDIIYAKALEKGLVEEDEELSEKQIIALIMEPGFSTADKVSDVSGRGVGMDVVKRNINNLGGSVEIDSVLGEGTTFTIRLPLTLAILDGQLIKVGSETYVLPLASIIESVPLSMASVTRIAGDMMVYKLHNEYIPIINLIDEFEIKDHSVMSNDGLLTIVEGDNKKIAILINELLGQQQVVIKSMESHYKLMQGVSGATILGDGRVSLILDVVGLARRSASHKKKHGRVA